MGCPPRSISSTPFQKTLSNTFDARAAPRRWSKSKADALGIIAAEFPAGVKPVLTVTSRVATRNYCGRSLRPRQGRTKANRAELEYFLRPTKFLPTDGIVKETATRDHERREDGSREGARDLRVDRRKHLSESEDARLRYRRHPLHAGVQGSGREMRRSQRALCRPGACRGPSGARRVWHPRRQVGTGIQEPGRLVGEHHEGAALPRGGVPATSYGWVPVDPADVRKVMLEEPPGNRPTGRRHGEESARAAIRVVGDELDGVQLRARRRAARIDRHAGRLPDVSAGGNQPTAGSIAWIADTFKYEITSKEITAAKG